MGTGIAVTCQAFRHLLKGDERILDVVGRVEAMEKSAEERILIGDRPLASGSNVCLEGDTVASIISSLKIQLSKDLKLSLLYSNQLQRSQCAEHQAEGFQNLKVTQHLKNFRLIL